MSHRKSGLALVLSIVALCLPALAPAATSVTTHSASGIAVATIDGAPRSIVFTAATLRSGGAAGLALVNNSATGETFLFAIDCLEIVNSQATMVGTVIWSTNPISIGLAGYFGAEDNGLGRKSTGPDRISRINGSFTPPNNMTQQQFHDFLCTSAHDGILQTIIQPQLVPLIFGDVQVR